VFYAWILLQQKINTVDLEHAICCHISHHLQHHILLISSPSLGVYYFLSLTLSVCPAVCLSQTLLLLFCFSMESSHFLAISSPWQKLQTCFLQFFYLGPLTPKLYSLKFLSVGHWVRHSLWVNDIWARRGDPVAHRLVNTDTYTKVSLANKISGVFKHVKRRILDVHFQKRQILA